MHKTEWKEFKSSMEPSGKCFGLPGANAMMAEGLPVRLLVWPEKCSLERNLIKEFRSYVCCRSADSLKLIKSKQKESSKRTSKVSIGKRHERKSISLTLRKSPLKDSLKTFQLFGSNQSRVVLLSCFALTVFAS